MQVCFIRTPRYLWPYNSEASSFWQPLAFAYLAAFLRQKGFPDVSILDAPAQRLGWRTVARHLRQNKPHVVCIGEEVCSAPEGIRLAKLAKEINPATITVAGGHLFSLLPEYGLRNGIDIVVVGEGETALLAALEELSKAHPRLSDVPGIVYRDGNARITRNARAQPIDDLDSLPLPAYDLLPMPLYGAGARVHQDLVAVEHSRGCIDRCDFCVLWRTMGRPDSTEQIQPLWRTKSPERTYAELSHLKRHYDRKTFAFVDSTWNVSPEWNDSFTDLILNGNERFEYTIWARADCIVRDAQNGLLEKMVRSGLVQVMLGVERHTDSSVEGLRKHNAGSAVSIRALEVLQEYPEVATLASLIYGTEDEDLQSLRSLARFGHGLPADFVFFIPMTPTPGTAAWRRAGAEGLLETEDFHDYNFHTPVMRSRHLSREQLSQIYFYSLFEASLRPFRWRLFSRLLGARTRRKRWFYIKLYLHALQILLAFLKRAVLQTLSVWKGPPLPVARKPSWYEN